ncbi:hypothetical protein ACRXB1_37295, partial [Caballeronia sp. M23-90]
LQDLCQRLLPEFDRIRLFGIQPAPLSSSDWENSEATSIVTQGDSVRQIPVSGITAQLVQTYVESYGGRPSHPLLLNSYLGNPLATESLTKAVREVSNVLPERVRRELSDRCGKDSVMPHDLRHTSAVVRLHQLLDSGDARDEALQKMRTFLGWSELARKKWIPC